MKNIKKEFENKKISLGTYISITHRQRQLYLKNIALKMDLNVGQVPLLLFLLDKKNSYQNEISESYKIDKGSIARSIKKLEDKELVKREIDETDRKKYKISLTDEGKKIALKIKKEDEKLEKELLKNIELDNDLLINAIKKITILSIELNNKGEKND